MAKAKKKAKKKAPAKKTAPKTVKKAEEKKTAPAKKQEKGKKKKIIGTGRVCTTSQTAGVFTIIVESDDVRIE